MGESTIRLGWHHLLFDVPASWEVVGFKKSRDDGQLVLSTRAGEAMLVFWRRVRGVATGMGSTGMGSGRKYLVFPSIRRSAKTGCLRPDPNADPNARDPAIVHRLVALVKANAGEGVAEAEVRGWIREAHGWSVCFPPDGAMPVFAARHLTAEGVLLQATFPPHRDTADREAIRRVLASYQPNGGAERVWAAFGLDITLPSEMDLAEVAPMPAAQRMHFENRRGHAVTVYRFGMMPDALGGDDVAAFFARVKGKGVALRHEGFFRPPPSLSGRERGRVAACESPPSPHPSPCEGEGVVLSYATRGKGDSLLSNLLDGTWDGRAWVWRRDDLQRVFAVENHAPPSRLIPDLPDRVRENDTWSRFPRRTTPGVVSSPARQGMEEQLAARPVANEAIRAEPAADGGLDLFVPLRHRGWSRLVKRLLPLSDERRVTLDRFGAEFFGLCDGERTLEAIVGLYMERWRLSFFEARALVVGYLRDLMRRGLVILLAP